MDNPTRLSPDELSAFAAGQRASDIITQHILDGFAGWWAAIRLSDGGSDGTAYPSKAVAVSHQLHEMQCCYVKIPFDSMPPSEAFAYIKLHRKLYDQGARIADPDVQYGFAEDAVKELVAKFIKAEKSREKK